MYRLHTALVVCAVIGLVGVITTSGDPIYLASSYHTLYRVSSHGDVESYTFNVALRSMHYDALADTVYVFGDAGGPGAAATIYRLDNAEDGTPSLIPHAALSHQYGGATLVDGTFYGFSTGLMYSIDVSDPTQPMEQYIGDTELGGTAGCAYSPATDTLYLASYDSGALYKVDRQDAMPTALGSLGVIGFDLDAEWYNEMLYLAIQNSSQNRFEFGIVDLETGQYKYLMTIADGATGTATGFAVIPEPAGVGLLSVLCLSYVARRRQ